MAGGLNVWTCGAGLLEALADAVLNGFPLADGEARPPLSAWTILVPTRRAARLLEQKLIERCKQKAVLLPRVRPIGDVDEELLDSALPVDGMADGISKTAHLFLMLKLVINWANANQQLPLAQDIASSPGQALGLAQSLIELVNQLETEEVDARIDGKFAGLDLAEHRQTIVSLLQLMQDERPRELEKLNRMAPAARRNRLLSREVERLAAGGHRGPIIAAGSTGTNPATRRLLKAIAGLPHGAVILPGLDTTLDDGAWDQVNANHPQHAMKLLLADFNMTRAEVRALRPATARERLVREVMRPAATTQHWFGNAELAALDWGAAREGLRLIEAPDRHLEARAIALLLREVLETPRKTAALVTPDRDLAQQVREELARWGARIDDSGGEPLIRFGRAKLCRLLMDCIEQDFAPATLVALVAEEQVTLGLTRSEMLRLAHIFEIACLRIDAPPTGPQEFLDAVSLARARLAKTRHAHPLLAALTAEDWTAVADFAARFASVLVQATPATVASLAEHVQGLVSAIDALSPPVAPEERDALHRSFDAVMEGLVEASSQHPICGRALAFGSITWALRNETVRFVADERTRLSVLGLAEARLIDADLVVLGGLNEAVWPAAVDPGPWVNRAMRQELGLAQPERDIGQTAHDFAQGMAQAHVVVTWTRRRGTSPLTPSRWILRLRALLEAQGLKAEDTLDSEALHWAIDMDRPTGAAATAKPAPQPDTALRPTQFSVTEIETLIRDPYAIFARKILKLEPLEPLGGDLNASLRGLVVHDALTRWMAQQPEPGSDPALLLAAGEAAFAPYLSHPDVRHFWWPRFKRIAQAFIHEDATLRADVGATVVELRGSLAFKINGVEHILTARADRIDRTARGPFRIIDYKTGEPPSASQVQVGLSPQLTLEAAILAQGKFGAEISGDVDDLVYVKASGGEPPVKIERLAGKLDPRALAAQHLARLKELLSAYRNTGQAYFPRTVVFKERDASPYDHLSRYDEWSRGGA